MNWDAITAIATLGSSIAVFITLVYLSIQVRNANKQRELESYRHTWDTLNDFCDVLSESTERAALVLKGRADRAQLSEAEQMVFDHIHLRMLNGLESWHHQLEQTMKPGSLRDTQIENIRAVIKMYFDFPGTRVLWREIRHAFIPIQHIVDGTLAAKEEDVK